MSHKGLQMFEQQCLGTPSEEWRMCTGIFFLTPCRDICSTIFHLVFPLLPRQSIPLFQTPNCNKLFVCLRPKSEEVNYTRTQNSSGTEGDLRETDSSGQVCTKRYPKEFHSQNTISAYALQEFFQVSIFLFCGGNLQ